MAESERDRHLPGLVLATAASGLAVVALGWGLGWIDGGQALLGAAAALGVAFLAALPFARDFRELILRARAIGEDDQLSQPPARRTAVGADLARALIESRRRVNRMQRGLEERAMTVEQVLDAAPEPLIVVDVSQKVVHANDAAERAFGGDFTGRPLVDVLRSPELLDATETVISGDEREAVVDVESTDLAARSYRAIVGRLPNVGGGGEAAVLAMQDLTAIRRLEAMRADFVANASHELRTPLANLVGFIETLEGPAKEDAAARTRFLGIMRDQAHRMARLVEDLLSLSKIEMEEYAPPGVTDDLADLIASVVEQLEPMAEARQIDVVVTGGDREIAVAGNPDLLQQVFRNLIENAIKYGRLESEVRISVALRGEDVRVAVADQGPGIPAEHLPRLTERFYRVDVARSREMGGTGLGLAIVKHILNRCRGRLDIASVVGQGSVFTVTLATPSLEERVL